MDYHSAEGKKNARKANANIILTYQQSCIERLQSLVFLFSLIVSAKFPHIFTALSKKTNANGHFTHILLQNQSVSSSLSPNTTQTGHKCNVHVASRILYANLDNLQFSKFVHFINFFHFNKSYFHGVGFNILVKIE